MKKSRFQISGGASLLASLLFLFCLPAFAAERITATIAVTNAAGTTNGQTVQIIAGDTTTRTWTNSVSVPATQILTNNTAAGAATNLYAQLVASAPLGIAPIVMGSSTNVLLYGQSGVPITITLSAGWGVVTYATQSVSSAWTVRVPNTVESAAQKTNVASGLVDWLNLTAATSQLNQTAPALAQFVGTTNTQTISGNKTFTGTLLVSNAAGIFEIGTIHATNYTGIINAISNGVWWSASLPNANLTNAWNWGEAFNSVGYSLSASVFGYGAQAQGLYSLSMGYGSGASNGTASAFGAYAYAAKGASTALGTAAHALADYSTAVGEGATVADTHTNSVAIGANAVTTKKNQIVLGSADHVVSAGGSVEHLYTIGTNSFSDIAFRRYAITSLANGNNAGVIIGTNTFVEVSGPSAAFTLNGLTGSPSRDGHLVVVVNQTGYDMTIAHQSGTDPVGANRIITMTGADRTTTGNGAATLIYSAAASRWLLIALDP